MTLRNTGGCRWGGEVVVVRLDIEMMPSTSNLKKYGNSSPFLISIVWHMKKRLSRQPEKRVDATNCGVVVVNLCCEARRRRPSFLANISQQLTRHAHVTMAVVTCSKGRLMTVARFTFLSFVS